MGTQVKASFNRWIVVFCAILIQLALGAIYAWSVFTNSLLKAPNYFTTVQTQAIFSAGLLSFALVMIFSGVQMKKVGPKPLLIAGGLVLGSGYILGSILGSSFISQLICIGIIGGAGIGLAYVVPIAVCIKWFPDKKGLISGLAVAGFGFGAIIWVKVGGSWFGLVENIGVQTVYFYYGMAFIIMVLVGSIWMLNPPEGFLPEGYIPPEPKEVSSTVGRLRNYTWQKMLGKGVFWTIWLIFVFSGMAGLMVIGTISLFGIDTLKNYGMDMTAASAIAGTAMAWYAIFNGLGRIVWGGICDRLEPRYTIFLLTLIQGILMITLFKMGTTPFMLIIYASAIGFNFGGNFSLFPTATAILFGAKNVGSNYPFVFTAYGIAGIAGPLIGGYVRDNTGTFLMAFIPAGIVCLVGAFLALTIKPPVERRKDERRELERRKVEIEKLKPEEVDRISGRRKKEGNRRVEKGIPWTPGTHGQIL
ncbi:MAG TPA: OFA family MFS transporter, partial [Anaerolineae bacterium]|nr:OFA family MFS transporter [Anaerolineae bacterium]